MSHGRKSWALLLLVVMGVAGVASADGPDHTEKPWRFVATCDSRGTSRLYQVNTNILRELAVAIAAESPELVLFAGDLVNGYPADTNAFLKWKAAMDPLYAAGIGVYPVRGNHDIGNAWEGVFGPDLPSNGPPGQIFFTYAVTNRNALFLGLDQYLPYHTVHQEWVDAQLAANRLPHVFAFSHEPAFKVRHVDCLGTYPVQRDVFWRSLKAGGARVYFCGHDHFFDHARLDDGDGNPANDLHQYVAGTAGAPFYPMDTYNGNNGAWTPVRHFFEAQYGYNLVTVDGTRVTLQWKRRLSPGVYGVGETFTYDVAQSEPVTRYVSPGGSHQAPFTSWETAATNIQAAIDRAVDFDTVLVAPGVYDTGGRVTVGAATNRIALNGYITVRGVAEPRDVVVVGRGPCGPGAVRCAYVGAHAELSGVTLTNGYTLATGDEVADLSGGGVWCGAGGTVSGCVIAGNHAYGLGGGGYAESGSVFANCLFVGNEAQHGGGVFMNGGGMVVHSTITRNHASAVLYGGGGGVAAHEGTSSIVNSIIYANNGRCPNWFRSGSGGVFLYCCTTPLPASSCVTNDPAFVDVSGGDFRLLPHSVCVDTAIPFAGIGRDLAGVVRPLDGNNDGHDAEDMGAYETVHATADTDHDTLSDIDEIRIHDTDPTDPDMDRDGASDGNEIVAGTDPRNTTSVLQITECRNVQGSGEVVVMWNAVTDRVYAVYGAVGVTVGGWSNVGQRLGRSGSLSYTNSPSSSLRYFRIGVRAGAP